MHINQQESNVAGYEEIILTNGKLSVTVVPQANMVISSFKKNGVELLGLKAGLQAYVENLKSFGIPFLAPWANRLKTSEYTVANEKIKFSFEGMKLDDNGYPMHGLMTAISGWDCTVIAEREELIVEGVFEYNSSVPHFESYPFPHTIFLTYKLSPTTLTVETRIHNNGVKPLPIAFGWHPHFITTVDKVKVVGQVKNIPLDSKIFPVSVVNPDDTDDVTMLYKMENEWQANMVTAEGEMILKSYNYSYMLKWFPHGEKFVAVEPMTANIDPFNNEPTLLTGGEDFTAVFSMEI
jgi:galactose mutarotase-like enzyme